MSPPIKISCVKLYLCIEFKDNNQRPLLIVSVYLPTKGCHDLDEYIYSIDQLFEIYQKYNLTSKHISAAISPSLWIWNWKSQCSCIKITLFSLNKWLIACVLVLIFLQLYDTILNFCFLFTSDLVGLCCLLKNDCADLSRNLIFSVVVLSLWCQ
jgi:hypothetical protein